MKNIDNYDFRNKKVIVRVDFNVPLDTQFNVTDDTRIKATIPTIKKILQGGGSVILMSHLGRPKGGPEDKFSLRHILDDLSKKLGVDVQFADDCIGESAQHMAAGLQPGQVLLLENLRFYKEEEAGDVGFAKKLADLADVYMNDAFGTAHRAHASTAVIAQFFPENKLFGYVMGGEVSSINMVLKEGHKPVTAILGGAKVSGKIEIINNLLDKVDNLVIGGGMMFTFIKAMGGKTGNSLVEDDLIETAKSAMEKAKKLGVHFYIPTDAVIADQFDNEANYKTCEADVIPDGWMGLDIGPKSVAAIKEIILSSSTLLWNGPMGVFEMDHFAQGTIEIAKAIAEATQKGAFSLVGGGDSVAAVNKYHLSDQISHVSTGGGAMLEYIEGKELPGVAAIEG
ncbi:MAG: phosphoglycerate kinase [Bacteroidetes bacterium GWF2_41_31]|nr:MAG: phosphoglycerate kinase [Bacteroidetes bacterium GWF2_41_31]OFZ07627.1 MAG: phosphoglycerate kinase [Bacteroidetes bacterium RIFOXYB12_FULL_41_6]